MKVPPSMMKPAGKMAFTPHIERYFPTRGPETRRQVRDAKSREDGFDSPINCGKLLLMLAKKTAQKRQFPTQQKWILAHQI